MHAGRRALAYTDNRMPRVAKSSAATPVPYLRPEAITFLRNLAKHNDRDWFAPRKAQFEAQLKEPMLALVRKITDAMIDFAPNHVRPAEKAIEQSVAKEKTLAGDFDGLFRAALKVIR